MSETAVATPATTHEVELLTLDPATNWTGLDQIPFERIAERTLELEHKGERGPLHVSFGRPIPIEGKGWCCPYRLSSMGRDFVGSAGGADSVHAVQQAMEMVHNQLSGMARSHTITFLGQSDWAFVQRGSGPGNSAAKCPVLGMSLKG